MRNVVNATIHRLTAVVEVNTAVEKALLADRAATFISSSRADHKRFADAALQ
jgi:hypothetical protein